MLWGNRSKKNAEAVREHGALGIDMNSNRLRAATGSDAHQRILVLDEPHPELALVIGLDKKSPHIGRSAVSLVRRLPHLSCAYFLPFLGLNEEWRGGKHKLSAVDALQIAFERIRPLSLGHASCFLGIPGYFSKAQAQRVVEIAARARFPIHGTACLALALAADPLTLLAGRDSSVEADPNREGWIVPLHRPDLSDTPFEIVFIDVDDHGMMGYLVRVEKNAVQLAGFESSPHGSTRKWKSRLLNYIADRFVHMCRRDPRDSAEAEQALFEQIDDSLDRIRFGQKARIEIRAAQWFQKLDLLPEEFEQALQPLTRDLLQDLRIILQGSTSSQPPRAYWLSHEAGRVPGLAHALHANIAEQSSVGVLRPEAGAMALARLADRYARGELSTNDLDAFIPIEFRKDTLPAPATIVKMKP